MPHFRSAVEREQSQLFEKYTNLANGNLYGGDEAPFKIHEYFRMGLLGKDIRMVQVNAGSALVEHIVADALTDMTIVIGDGEDDTDEKEIREQLDEMEYMETLEEVARNIASAGHGETQIHRLDDGTCTITAIDPSTWYPDAPTFVWQEILAGRIITPFDVQEGNTHQWYAFIEQHEIGKVTNMLYKIDNKDSIEGKLVPLSILPRFTGLEEVMTTGLDAIPIIGGNWQKRTGEVYGRSLLAPIFDILQEVSEIQTQIRQERIKHFRSRMAVPRDSLMRVDTSNDPIASNLRSSAIRDIMSGARYDMNQEVFPIRAGDPMPAFITWDMQTIEKGSAEIDKLLSRAASIVGFPRSVFNLDDKGTVHVETEKRKDRRYVRKVVQLQSKIASITRKNIQLMRKLEGKDNKPVRVTFSSPFDLTREETVTLMRQMNGDQAFVSRERAVKEIWKELKPNERATLIEEIDSESQAMSPVSSLRNPSSISL